MMAPFTIDELDDLNVFTMNELDRIHRINKFLSIFTFIIIIFLVLSQFLYIL